MKHLLALSLLVYAFGGSVSGAVPTVSSVYADHIGHGTALIHFTVSNSSPNGDGTLWTYLRWRWAVSPTTCSSGSGGNVVPTGYPTGETPDSSNIRRSTSMQFIASGLYPAASVINICPELSNDNSTWSTGASGQFTLLPLPADHSQHPSWPILPTATFPTVPDVTGFHSGASTGGTTVTPAGPFPVTSCANLQSDFHQAVLNQASFGTVIALAAGSTCTGRYYPDANPPDVHQFTNSSVSSSTITWSGHGFSNGQGLVFAKTYYNLPGENNTNSADCQGIKPGEIYYVANATTNNFQLSCHAPLSSGGTLMAMADNGSPYDAGADFMYAAPYPRNLYPIVIRTATPDAQFVPPGVRVSPAWTSKMAKLKLDALGQLAFYAPVGATIRTSAFDFGFLYDDPVFYLNAKEWLIGIEIEAADQPSSPGSNPTPSWGMAFFKEGVTDSFVDRCYMHGLDGYPNRVAEGVALEGHNTGILNSYIDRIGYPRPVSGGGYDGSGNSGCCGEGSQFLQSAVGPGPLILYNTYDATTGNGNHFNGGGSPQKETTGFLIQRMTFTQPQRYCYGSTTSDGNEYLNRQPLEWKGGHQILIDGTIFDTDCHSIAGTPLAITSVTPGGISDVTVQNTTYRHLSGGATMGSSTQGGAFQSWPTSRYRYFNNLFWDINGCTYTDQLTGLYTQIGNRRCWNGWIIHAMGDGDDQIFDHNTVYAPSGANPTLFWLGHGGAEGVQITNNVLHVVNDVNERGAKVDGGTNFTSAPACALLGEALLTCSSFFPNPIIANNVLTTDSADYSTLNSWWPGQFVPSNPADLSQIGWYQPSFTSQLPNFRLKSRVSGAVNPYVSGGAHRATDGTDIGANINALEAAQGKVTLVGVPNSSITSSAATVSFIAPDSQGCPVDYSATDPSLISFLRAPDAGSARTRSVALSGLSTKTVYYYRVNCAVEQPTGQFRTK